MTFSNDWQEKMLTYIFTKVRNMWLSNVLQSMTKNIIYKNKHNCSYISNPLYRAKLLVFTASWHQQRRRFQQHCPFCGSCPMPFIPAVPPICISHLDSSSSLEWGSREQSQASHVSPGGIARQSSTKNPENSSMENASIIHQVMGQLC